MGYALKHFKDVAGSVGLLPGAVSFLKENVGRGKYNEDMLLHSRWHGLHMEQVGSPFLDILILRRSNFCRSSILLKMFKIKSLLFLHVVQ